MDESLIEIFKQAITEGKEVGLTIDQIFDLLETGSKVAIPALKTKQLLARLS